MDNGGVEGGFDEACCFGVEGGGEAAGGVVVVDGVVEGVGVEVGADGEADGVGAEEFAGFGVVVALAKEDEAGGIGGGAMPDEGGGVGEEVGWWGGECLGAVGGAVSAYDVGVEIDVELLELGEGVVLEGEGVAMVIFDAITGGGAVEFPVGFVVDLGANFLEFCFGIEVCICGLGRAAFGCGAGLDSPSEWIVDGLPGEVWVLDFDELAPGIPGEYSIAMVGDLPHLIVVDGVGVS